MSKPATQAQRCPDCGGRSGDHGQAHRRHPTGGGGTNRPCLREESTAAADATDPLVLTAACWVDQCGACHRPQICQHHCHAEEVRA